MAQITHPEAKQLAEAFLGHYYQVFDSNRAGLAPMYQAPSMLVFEGQRAQGGAEIVQKLAGLPFQAVAHRITSFDALPSGAGPRGVLVMVTGDIVVNNDAAQTHKFTQSFHLVPQDGNPNAYWIHNDIFRIG